MGRAKLRLELIAKENTRNTTYHKRKDGMLKKAKELSILCAVDTVVIIHPPNSNHLQIWPDNNPDKIKKTIAFYKKKKGETGKRSYNVNDFLEDRMKKLDDELDKARKKNMEAKYPTWFDDLNGFDELQLRQVAMELNIKENIVRAHFEIKQRNIYAQLPLFINDQQPMVQYDHGQVMNQGHGWFNDEAMALFMKREQMGLGYPVYDNPNQRGLQPHKNVTRQLAWHEQELEQEQELGSQVNNDFMVDDASSKF